MRYLRTPHKTTQLLLVLGDVSAIVASAAAATAIVPQRWLSVSFLNYELFALLFALYLGGAYDIDYSPSPRARSFGLVVVVVLITLVGYPLLYVAGHQAVRGLGAFTITLAVLFVGIRLLISGSFDLRKRALFVVRPQTDATRIQPARRQIDSYCHVVGITHMTDDSAANEHLVRDAVRNEHPDLVVCETTACSPDFWRSNLFEVAAGGARLWDFALFYSGVTGRVPVELGDPDTLLTRCVDALQQRHLARARRVFDIAFAIVLGLPALPIIAVVAVAVWLDGGRPVFFSQQRLGRYQRPFKLHKFRTMMTNAEDGGPKWAVVADPRVTRIGRLLRASRLDELPQLLNVLRGDMTMIGPRPIRRVFADQLTAREPLYAARFLLTPGLTGWPQVMGPYGQDVGEHLVKLEMDLYYLIYGGLLDDVYILVRTVRTVLGGRGI